MIDIEYAVNDLNRNIDFTQRAGGEQFMATPGEIAILLTALQVKNGSKDKEIERLKDIVEAYAESARSVALWLDAYCDRSLPYDKMILDAAQKAVVALSRVEAERDAAKRTLDGICGQIDNDCWLRKQFCENGDGDLEPCPCPSLREHDGYIDSDDCEGCECFVNSWRGAQGEE